MKCRQTHQETAKLIVIGKQNLIVPFGGMFRASAWLASATTGSSSAAPRIRKAFVMSVFPGKEAEYEARHSPIWTDLHATLKAHRVHNYSIFLLPATHQLFGYAEIESEAQWAAIADTPVCKRWWKFMADVMPANADNSPVAAPLQEVFHMD